MVDKMTVVDYCILYEEDVVSALLWHLHRNFLAKNPGWLKPEVQKRYDEYERKAIRLWPQPLQK